MRERAISPRATLLTGAALLALWGLSWALSYVSFGSWSLPVALGIAAVKAVLVALFFMELRVERASFNLALATAVALIAVLIGLVVGDVATRAPPPLGPPPVAYPLAEDLP